MRSDQLSNVLLAMARYASDRASQHHSLRGEATEARLFYSFSFMLQQGAEQCLKQAVEEANREPMQPLIVADNWNSAIDACIEACFNNAANHGKFIPQVLEALKRK